MSSNNNGQPPFSLVQSVEVTELYDVQDEDVGGYIQELINSCTQIPKKKRFDLSTPVDAYAALAIVERAVGHIAARMKVVRALRILLRARQTDREFDMQ